MGGPALRVVGGLGVGDAGGAHAALARRGLAGDVDDGAHLGAGGVGHVDVLSGRSRRVPCAGPAPHVAMRNSPMGSDALLHKRPSYSCSHELPSLSWSYLFSLLR